MMTHVGQKNKAFGLINGQRAEYIKMVHWKSLVVFV